MPGPDDVVAPVAELGADVPAPVSDGAVAVLLAFGGEGVVEPTFFVFALTGVVFPSADVADGVAVAVAAEDAMSFLTKVFANKIVFSWIFILTWSVHVAMDQSWPVTIHAHQHRAESHRRRKKGGNVLR